mmetsp:Transcript_40404/g.73194  ORF Transcript_40404/g.73194 Transcript_40404/m.73194 type:complete len:489 (-) Transcript_40404:47-1513(-)
MMELGGPLNEERRSEDAQSLAAGSGQDGHSAVRQQIAALLDNPESSTLAQSFHYALFFLIIGSTTLTMMETMTIPEIRDHMAAFQAVDWFVTVCFTIELCLRVYAAESWVAYLSNCHNVVDIFAVLPSYVELYLLFWADYDTRDLQQAVDSMRTLRITRVVRLVRVFRVVRLVDQWYYLEQMLLIFRVLFDSSSSRLYAIYDILLLLGSTTMIAASLMYVFEIPSCFEDSLAGVTSKSGLLERSTLAGCPTASHFDSILSAWWWAVITLTTVGYGDVVPATVPGKVVGGTMCLCAVMIVAIAAARFSIQFQERWVQVQASFKVRKHFAGDAALLQEQEELEQLLLNFDQSIHQLLGKVSCASAEAGGGIRSVALSPLRVSIEGNAAALRSGACSFLHEVLAEARLGSTGASCNPKTSPMRQSSRSRCPEERPRSRQGQEAPALELPEDAASELLLAPEAPRVPARELLPLTTSPPRQADRLDRRLMTN